MIRWWGSDVHLIRRLFVKFKELFTYFPDFKQITKLDIENIEITNMTVLDAPDFYRWCKPRELPVSSGYIFYKGLDLIETIKLCDQYNVVGLAIKVDRFLKEIPQEVITYAESLNFPLIHIPKNFSFSEVILPVMNTSLADSLDEVANSEKIRDHFIKLALHGNNLSEIVDYLHQVMRVDVFLDNHMTGEFYKNGQTYDHRDFKADNYTSQTINFGQDELGVFYFDVKFKELSYSQEIAINYATKIIQLIYRHKLSLQKVKEDYKSDLVEDICNNNINSRQELQLRSKLYGWNISDKLIVGIFDIDNYKEETVKLGEESGKLTTVHSQMYSEIVQNFDREDIVNYSFKKSDAYIFIFERESFDSLDHRDQLLEAIRKKLQQKFNFSFTVSLGNPVNDVLETYKSYGEAMQGVRLARILYKGDTLTHYRDVEPYTLLANISQDISFNHSIMKPIMDLKEFDKLKGTEYLSDLQSLIDSDWNISEYSKNEIIHYNTAKYRLRKIETITGLDLSKDYNKFNIEFALKLYLVKHS